MKFRNELILMFFFINIFVISSEIERVNAEPRYLGIQVSDGTAIQVYDESSLKKDRYYPQDCATEIECVLEIDVFFVFIDFTDFDDSPRNVSIELFREESKILKETITSENGSVVEIVERNVTEFTKLINSKEITINKGDNSRQDTRYGIKRIDSSILPDLRASDNKELIVVTYLELEVKFYHKTNYDKVPIIQTRGEFWGFTVWQVVIFAVCVLIGLTAGGYITGKVNHVYPPVPISSIIIVFLLVIISYLVNIILEGLRSDLTEATQSFVSFPIELISIALAVGIAVYTPSRFRNKSTGKVLLLSANVPYEDRKDILDRLSGMEVDEAKRVIVDEYPFGDWLDLHYYYTWNKKKVYTENPDSFFGFFSNLFFGGIKIDYESTMRVHAGKQKLDEIIFTLGFKKSSKPVIPKKYEKPFMLGVGITFLVSMFFSIFFRELIVIPILLVAFSVTLFAYQKTETMLTIEIDPLTRNATAAIMNAKSVRNMENSYRETLLENVDLKRNAKSEIIRRENAARLESWLIWAAVYSQESFAKEMPKYVKILSGIGLDKLENGQYQRKQQTTDLDEKDNLDEYEENQE